MAVSDYMGWRKCSKIELQTKEGERLPLLLLPLPGVRAFIVGSLVISFINTLQGWSANSLMHAQIQMI